MNYRPIIVKVPFGYQGLIGIYSGEILIDQMNNDDAVFDSEIIALHHAQREIEKLKETDRATN
jgi:hypothetical protein